MEEMKVLYADDLKFDFIVDSVPSTVRQYKFYNGYITKGDITEVYIINAKTDIIDDHFIISTSDIDKLKNVGVFKKSKMGKTLKIRLCGKLYHSGELSRIILDATNNTDIAYRNNSHVLDYTRDNLMINKKKDVRRPLMAKYLCSYENSFDHHGNKLPPNVIYDYARKHYTTNYKSPEKNMIRYRTFTEKQYETLDKALERAIEFTKLGFVISREKIILFDFNIKTDQLCIHHDINRGNSRMFYINSNNPNLLDMHVNTRMMHKYIVHVEAKYFEYLKNDYITILKNYNYYYAIVYVEDGIVKQPLKQYGLKTKVIKIGENEFNLEITPIEE